MIVVCSRRREFDCKKFDCIHSFSHNELEIENKTLCTTYSYCLMTKVDVKCVKKEDEE